MHHPNYLVAPADSLVSDARAMLDNARQRLDMLRQQMRTAESVVAALELALEQLVLDGGAPREASNGGNGHARERDELTPSECAACGQNIGTMLARQLDDGRYVHAQPACDPLLRTPKQAPHRRKRTSGGPLCRRGELRLVILQAYARNDGRPLHIDRIRQHTMRHKPASLRRRHISDKSWAARVAGQVHRMVRAGELAKTARGLYKLTGRQARLGL